MAAADAVENVERARGGVLVGAGPDDGVGVRARTSSPRVQLEEVSKWVPWGLVVEPAKEGPPLSPIGPGPMEVDGTKEALEDGATVGEAMDKETDSSLQPS